jgi:hypothetical protein
MTKKLHLNFSRPEEGFCRIFTFCFTKKKLYKYGNSSTTYNWLKSYLKDRKQKVDIDGSYSSTLKHLIYRVVYWIKFFLIYVNNFYSISDFLKIMFADHTPCLASNTNLNDLILYYL